VRCLGSVRTRMRDAVTQQTYTQEGKLYAKSILNNMQCIWLYY
jgi:hypothetical protein